MEIRPRNQLKRKFIIQEDRTGKKLNLRFTTDISLDGKGTSDAVQMKFKKSSSVLTTNVRKATDRRDRLICILSRSMEEEIKLRGLNLPGSC
jgi:hypothetical protein